MKFNSLFRSPAKVIGLAESSLINRLLILSGVSCNDTHVKHTSYSTHRFFSFLNTRRHLLIIIRNTISRTNSAFETMNIG